MNEKAAEHIGDGLAFLGFWIAVGLMLHGCQIKDVSISRDMIPLYETGNETLLPQNKESK